MPRRIRVGIDLVAHRAEFVDGEGLALPADARLRKNDRSGTFEANTNRAQCEQWEAEHRDEARQTQVDCTLAGAIEKMGAGMSETLLNGAVAERYAGQPVRMLSAMHAAVTVGAALGPLLMGWIAARFHWSMSFVLIGCAYIALAGAAMAVTFPAHKRHDHPPRLYEKLLSYSMLPFALMLFGYVGIEGGLAIFASPLAWQSPPE